MNAKVDVNNPDLVTIEIDGVEMKAPKGSMIIQAADEGDVYIPRFCYHKKLPIAANCRMCLVEVEKAPKPMPACATPVADGMKVFTKSKKALAAQRGVMEFLLINHPLDCPICDQGGECELQDLSLGYGRGVSRFTERKRSVADENLGPLISTEMTRCIHCTRCVRFLDVVAGKKELGGMGRGEHMEISTYIEHGVSSELSGNIVDLCPVGALTSKPYRFTARAWELLSHPAVAPHDAVGSNVFLHHRRGRIMRVIPRENEAVNEVWISDRDRFSYEGVYAEDRLQRPMVKRDGEWEETDWETALEAASAGLRKVVDQHGPQGLGALVSPTSTAEEMYLTGKLIRALGSRNIDHRLRDADFSDQNGMPVFPSVGMPLADIERLDAALIVGSYTRWEQPLLNHRLRKAALKGADVAFVNPRGFEFNFPVARQFVAAPQHLVAELAAIAAALSEGAADATAPDSLAKLVSGATPSDSHRLVARKLKEAERAAIFVGALVDSHPDGSQLRALASLIADLAEARFGFLPVAANTVGGWLSGAVPHRKAGSAREAEPGATARDMLAKPMGGYLLLGVEPEYDCWEAGDAIAALNGADCVVSLTSYLTETVKSYADVLLPIATFGETSGTYVNMEGRWQSAAGVGQPLGEARPAWKVLRVLGNLFSLAGFDYTASDEVLAELREVAGAQAQDGGRFTPAPAPTALPNQGLIRAGSPPIYAADTLVRRARSLQRTVQTAPAAVYINQSLAESLALSDGDRAVVRQGERSAELSVKVDAAIPDGSVWIPVALSGSVELGPATGEVSLERA